MNARTTILLFASTPADVDRLNIDEEARSITAKIRTSDHRETLNLVSNWATRPDDLLQKLNEHRPTVVHFSGHGSQVGELVLMDESRQPKAVSAAALKTLFSALKGNIRLVVLNACYSKIQAAAIATAIDCVIGMDGSIGDEAAIAFAASFYSAIGFGGSVKDAFEQGKVALMLEGIPEEHTPDLLSREGVNPANIYLVDVPARQTAERDEIVAVTETAIAELRTLDNAIRSVLGPLTTFTEEWSAEGRDRVIAEMRALADTEVTLPRVREMFAHLEERTTGFQLDPDVAAVVEVVLACGRATLVALGRSEVTPWPGPRELAAIIQAIRVAKTPAAAEFVRAGAQKLIGTVDRARLGKANELLGRLKGRTRAPLTAARPNSAAALLAGAGSAEAARLLTRAPEPSLRLSWTRPSGGVLSVPKAIKADREIVLAIVMREAARLGMPTIDWVRAAEELAMSSRNSGEETQVDPLLASLTGRGPATEYGRWYEQMIGCVVSTYSLVLRTKRTWFLRAEIHNDGSAPATRVTIDVDLPPGVKPEVPSGGLWSVPAAPSGLDALKAPRVTANDASVRLPAWADALGKEPDVQRPCSRIDAIECFRQDSAGAATRLRGTTRTLQHGESSTLRPIPLHFVDSPAAPLDIPYRLHAENQQTDVRSAIQIAVREVDDPSLGGVPS